MKPFFNLSRIVLLFCVTFVTCGTAVVASAQGSSPDDAIAIFNHGQDLHERGDLKAAIAEYDRALKLLPEFPEAEYQRAAAELALGDLVEAERSLRRATETRPEWSLAWGMLSDVLVRRYSAAPIAQRSGLATDAEATIAQALKLDPANVAALTSLVDLRLSSGASRDDLAGTLKKLIPVTEGKMSPAASLWTARAAVENALGDHRSAKNSIARAIELDPGSSASMFVAADIALADDLDRAKHLSAALASKNADPARLSLLNAKIAAAEGRSADAIALLDKVPPSPATDELRREIASSVVSDPSELEKLLAAGPPNPALLGRLCSAYRRNDPVKALAYCKRASEADPNNLTPAAGYAAALVQAKDFTAAVSMLRRLLEIAPDNSTLHANLATALFELKDYPAAQKEFEWLSNSDAKAAAPYFFLGIIHDRSEEYVDALGAYEQYLRLADPVANRLDIEKVELRLPTLRRLVKEGKGKKVRS